MKDKNLKEKESGNSPKQNRQSQEKQEAKRTHSLRPGKGKNTNPSGKNQAEQKTPRLKKNSRGIFLPYARKMVYNVKHSSLTE